MVVVITIIIAISDCKFLHWMFLNLLTLVSLTYLERKSIFFLLSSWHFSHLLHICIHSVMQNRGEKKLITINWKDFAINWDCKNQLQLIRIAKIRSQSIEIAKIRLKLIGITKIRSQLIVLARDHLQLIAVTTCNPEQRLHTNCNPSNQLQSLSNPYQLQKQSGLQSMSACDSNSHRRMCNIVFSFVLVENRKILLIKYVNIVWEN